MLHHYTPSTLYSLYGSTATLRGAAGAQLQRLTSSPDLASIALLLVIAFVSLKLLGLLWRTVVFWVGLAARALFWAGLVVGGLYVANRGVDGAVEDARHWAEAWAGEYRGLREQVEMARGAEGGKGGARRGAWI